MHLSQRIILHFESKGYFKVMFSTCDACDRSMWKERKSDY